jgi:phosphomevalonate kinase
VAVFAEAPGKLVILGEYAVLTGAPALVLAVDRYCRAEIAPSEDEFCHLCISAPDPKEISFSPGSASGVDIVDLVTATDGTACSAWRASVDSRRFFAAGTKLGVGSSAAAMTAWAAAWSAYRGQAAIRRDVTSLETLIGLHRAFQGGSGSGLDIAASLFGGAIIYELVPDSAPRIGSVQLPNSVGFTSVSTGYSASTGGFVAAFNDWVAARPDDAREQLKVLEQLTVNGCAAASENEAGAFLRAVSEYGARLGDLGERIGTEIVTAEHRELAASAARFGVAYKVSGAGGGDLGIALSADQDALAAFSAAVEGKYQVIDFCPDETGLRVEELED